jgi:GNAT superfamily N-acetyltransferase
MSSALSAQVATVREFSRFYTRRLGTLDEGLLETPWSLTEARVIFELGQVDGRRQALALTAAGRKLFRTLNDRSNRQVLALLAPLPEPVQESLVGAMRTVMRALDERATPPMIVLRGLRPGDLGWVVQRHGEVYAREYGWAQTFEALVARIVADYLDQHQPSRENAWIAEIDGQRAGCVFCVREDGETAQLRILLVESWARGHGLGARLVDECVRFARDSGYRKLVLWTNDVLVSARRIYLAAGFELVSEERHHSFGKDLVGQFWALRL